MVGEKGKDRKLIKFFSGASIVFGCLLITFYFFHPDAFQMAGKLRYSVLILGCISSGLGILAWTRNMLPVISVNIGIFGILYLFLELVYYLFLGFPTSLPQSNSVDQPCTSYDLISGYRWKENTTCRITRIGNGEVIFDQTFTPNNMGYISSRDFKYKKEDTATFRYMVFGDSFTAGEFLEQCWPDRLHTLLNEDSPVSYEIYSFAVDGGGLLNWHNIYFKDILPNYEFDGIIIASYLDNLKRELFIMHSTDEFCMMGYINQAPDSLTEIDNLIKRFKPAYQIRSNDEIDVLIKGRNNKATFEFKKPSLYAMVTAAKWIGKIHAHRNKVSTGELIKMAKEDPIGFIYAYRPKHKVEKMEQIITSCQSLNKKVILATVPKRELALRSGHLSRGEKENVHQLELAYYAEKFGVSYFDFYPHFIELPDSVLQNHYLKYDGHWNQRGSDLFAEELYKHILSIN